MQIDEVEKNLIKVLLELRLKEEKKVETKKQMNREEFYTWTQNFEAKFFGQFNDFNQRLSTIEQRLDQIEVRLDKIEKRLDKVEQRLDKVEERLDKVEERLDKVEARLDVLEKDVKDIKNRLARIESCPTIKKELELLNN
ncbi:MAG: hypothetical protein IIT78_01055 [Mycoplasmataceae bacterium]|nr:hypothetical protein [Mycoplasmataceae bacterium]